MLFIFYFILYSIIANPQTQDMHKTYIQHSEVVLGVFQTSDVCSTFVVYPEEKWKDKNLYSTLDTLGLLNSSLEMNEIKALVHQVQLFLMLILFSLKVSLFTLSLCFLLAWGLSLLAKQIVLECRFMGFSFLKHANMFVGSVTEILENYTFHKM